MRMPFVRSNVFIALLAVALTGGCASSQSGSKREGGGGGGEDRSALQGRWEQLPADPGASGTPRQRVVKEVNGDRETVTTYGPDGKVLQSRTTGFSLSRNGPVRVFTIENAGADGRNTATSLAQRTYVYRVRGDEFDEVWGLLPGQEEREVIVKRWRREGTGR